MSTGFYVEGNSFLRRLHPVTRIVALFLFFVPPLAFDDPLHLLAAGLAYLFALARSGALPGLKKAAVLLLLVAFASFLIWSFAYGGETVLIRLGPLAVSREGMIHGAAMGIRLDALSLCGLVFLSVTSVEEFNYGLTKMGVPFPIGFALSLSFRLVPLFAETVSTIQDAQRARGLDPSAGGPAAKARAFAPLLVPVFASALRRTDLMATALESKGFGNGRKRGSLLAPEAGWRDVAALLFAALFAGLSLALRYFGLGVI